MTEQRRTGDTWNRLLADFKRACQGRSEVRFALVDAWAAYITQQEDRVAELEAALKVVASRVPHWPRTGGAAGWNQVTEPHSALCPACAADRALGKNSKGAGAPER